MLEISLSKFVNINTSMYWSYAEPPPPQLPLSFPFPVLNKLLVNTSTNLYDTLNKYYKWLNKSLFFPLFFIQPRRDQEQGGGAGL